MSSLNSSYDVSLLTQLGFEEVGHWHLSNSEPSYELRLHHRAAPVLYAFVIQSQVLYIGKSSRTLNQRLYGYSRPEPTQRTNIRVKQSIGALLADKADIRVFALVQWDEVQYRGVVLNVPAALEDVLITRLRPPWNIQGR